MMILRPLVGLSCIDEAMPPGTDLECIGALASAPVLCTAFELSPEPVMSEEMGGNTPKAREYTMENEPKPAFGPK